MEKKKTALFAGGAVVLLIGLLLGISSAVAWPSPSTSATGGACNGTTTPTPITWTVTNNESGNKLSPAHIVNVHVTPSFATSQFAPLVLPNTGVATATASTTLPDGFTGDVHLTYTMTWVGKDGTDQRDGGTTVHVSKCEGPTTTTTSTTSTTAPTTTTSTSAPTTTTTSTVPTTTSTSTTSTSTTSTTAPTTTTSTTSTTLPTTTTSTTVKPTTTSTSVPTTTTTRPTTSSTSTTVVTVPSTTTTLPVTSTSSSVVDSTTTTTPPPVSSEVPPTTSVCDQTPPPYGCVGTTPAPPGPTNPPLPKSLVVTGADSGVLLVSGLICVAAGLVLLLMARGKRG